MENCRKPRKLQETHRKPQFLLSVHRETQGKVAGNRGNLRKPIGNRRKPLRKPLVFEEVLSENTIFGHTPGSIYITKLKVGSPPPRPGACGSPTTKPARSSRILGGVALVVPSSPSSSPRARPRAKTCAKNGAIFFQRSLRFHTFLFICSSSLCAYTAPKLEGQRARLSAQAGLDVSLPIILYIKRSFEE